MDKVEITVTNNTVRTNQSSIGQNKLLSSDSKPTLYVDINNLGPQGEDINNPCFAKQACLFERTK